jgi:hypothetical protein
MFVSYGVDRQSLEKLWHNIVQSGNMYSLHKINNDILSPLGYRWSHRNVFAIKVTCLGSHSRERSSRRLLSGLFSWSWPQWHWVSRNHVGHHYFSDKTRYMSSNPTKYNSTQLSIWVCRQLLKHTLPPNINWLDNMTTSFHNLDSRLLYLANNSYCWPCQHILIIASSQLSWLWRLNSNNHSRSIIEVPNYQTCYSICLFLSPALRLAITVSITNHPIGQIVLEVKVQSIRYTLTMYEDLYNDWEHQRMELLVHPIDYPWLALEWN